MLVLRRLEDIQVEMLSGKLAIGADARRELA
jgi:hypothetical protein